jgi:hypothetical protein
LSLDSSSKSSNSLDLEESDELDESDESKTLEDQRFRREMDKYNTIIARAYEMAKREL